MALSPDCLAHLALRRSPFETLDDESFVYRDPVLDRLLAAARQALTDPWRVLLLIGEPGSGRSLQLTRLIGVLPERGDLIAFRARAGIGTEAIEATIRNQLLGTTGENAWRALAELLAARPRPLLIIDDAHLLEPGALDALRRLHQSVRLAGGQGFRLLLVGDTAFGTATAGPSPSAALAAADPTPLAIPPFTLEQTAAYLLHRLRAAGSAAPERLLMPEDIVSMHTMGLGRPGALNRLAAEWLESCCESVRELTGAAAATPPAAVGKDVGGVPDGRETLAPPIFAPAPAVSPRAPPESPRRSPPLTDPEPPDTAVRPEPTPKRHDGPARPNADGRIRTNPAASAEVLDGLLPGPRGHRPSPPRHPGARRGAGDPGPAAILNRRWFLPAVAGAAAVAILLPAFWFWSTPERLDQDDRDRYWTPAPSGRGAAASGAAADPGGPRRPPSAPAAPMNDGIGRLGAPLPEPLEDRAANGDASTPRPDAPDAGDGDAPPMAGTSPTDEETLPPERELSAEKGWMARQNARHFTIQLIALSSLAAAERYAAELGLSDVRYLPTRHNQQELVVVLSGSYPNRAAAETALRALPERVRAERPWIRSFASVGAALR